MQTVILCGGYGTRLRSETEFKPKPMVNIGKWPILWHTMKIYTHYGHNEFILSLGYKGEMIKNYFCHYELMNNDFTIELGEVDRLRILQSHKERGWKITLADTGENALKGARIKRVEKYVTDEIFMLTYGDGVADIDIDELVSFHKSHGKLATVTGINPSSRFGELKIEGNRVESFSEKTRNSERYVNGGFFVFNRGIFDYLHDGDDCDLEYGPLEKIANEGQLMVYKHKGFWACMDTPRDMEYLNKLWADGEADWKVW